MTSELSVFARSASAEMQSDPFPHLITDEALDPSLYKSLMEQFPSIEHLQRKPGPLKSNHLYLLSAAEVLAMNVFSADWKRFFEYHVSQAFWREALELIKHQLLQLHPTLEARAERSLDEFRVGVRQRDGSISGEIALDCQFAVNSPVTTESTVRTPHLDRPNKLFNAILYCRADNDDTPGGELTLYRCVAPCVYSKGSAVMPTRIVAAKRIDYRANRLVLFISSPHSVHGVSPRPVTRHCRRYINILCEFREPLFQIPSLSWIGRTLELSWNAFRKPHPEPETVI